MGEKLVDYEYPRYMKRGIKILNELANEILCSKFSWLRGFVSPNLQ